VTENPWRAHRLPDGEWVVDEPAWAGWNRRYGGDRRYCSGERVARRYAALRWRIWRNSELERRRAQRGPRAVCS
jgi:hypothetical protein